MAKLTDRFLTGLELAEGQRDRLVFDTACPGLGVRLTKSGTRTFIAQWTDPATKRKVREPLGVWGALTIDQAREAARVRLGDVAKGINPKAVRVQARVEAERERAELALTFDALVTDWATYHLVKRRPRYAAEAERALRHAFADLMKRPAARITRSDARAVLDKLVTAGKATMAAQTLAYGRAAFRWAEKRGVVAGNPFQGLPIATTTQSRDRVLTDSELAEVWAAAGAMAYPFGPMIRTAILTLQRREEVAGMRWSEISDDGALWIIPAERMKNGKPHAVRLSSAARDVLAKVPKVKGQDLIFTTTGNTPVSGFSRAKLALDRIVMEARAERAKKAGTKAPKLAPWRLHDLRRTGVSKLAALGIDSIVADKLLAHKAGRLYGVAAVYQRHDFAQEQAHALDAWAAHVVPGPAASNVVKLASIG
jgi:integrase